MPPWYQKYMLQYQSLAGIYIIEDRFQGGLPCCWFDGQHALFSLVMNAASAVARCWLPVRCAAWRPVMMFAPSLISSCAAIRVAIGMAQQREVVLVVGKGEAWAPVGRCAARFRFAGGDMLVEAASVDNKATPGPPRRPQGLPGDLGRQRQWL